MDINEIITRLKSQCPLLQNRVYGSAELATAQPTSVVTPCAFVVPLSEKAQPNTFYGAAVMQEITLDFGILIAVKNLRDPRGENAFIDLQAIRQSLRTALIGWQPVSTASNVEMVSGSLVAYDNMTLRWSDIFRTNYYYRNV